MKVQTTSWINMDTYSSELVQTEFRKPFWVWPWWTYQVKLGCVYGFLRPPRTCVDYSSADVQWSFQTWTQWTFTFKYGTHRTWRHSNHQTWSPSKWRPSNMMKPFSRLQTWSHQRDNPRNDAFKHEAIRYEALQTWSTSKTKTSKHEALQTWWNLFKTSDMQPSTWQPSKRCLQTWSHQTWSPEDKRQTGSPSNMMPYKQFTMIYSHPLG